MPTETAVSERMDRPPGWRRHAGLINVAAKLSGAAFAFLLNILLARSMEPTGFAHVSLTLAWLAGDRKGAGQGKRADVGGRRTTKQTWTPR